MNLVGADGETIKKDKFRVPEQFRIAPLEGFPSGKHTNNGYFSWNLSKKKNIQICCLASCGFGWDHVSCHIIDKGTGKTPSWDMMSYIKDIFWEPEARVIQIHPPHSEYVDNHPNVLHLWRWHGGEIPHPPFIMVGPEPNKLPRDLSAIYGK